MDGVAISDQVGMYNVEAKLEECNLIFIQPRNVIDHHYLTLPENSYLRHIIQLRFSWLPLIFTTRFFGSTAFS